MRTPELSMFRFDKEIYKGLQIYNETAATIKKYDEKRICNNCYNSIVHQIKKDDYRIREVQHCGVKNACIPLTNNLKA